MQAQVDGRRLLALRTEGQVHPVVDVLDLGDTILLAQPVKTLAPLLHILLSRRQRRMPQRHLHRLQIGVEDAWQLPARLQQYLPGHGALEVIEQARQELIHVLTPVATGRLGGGERRRHVILAQAIQQRPNPAKISGRLGQSGTVDRTRLPIQPRLGDRRRGEQHQRDARLPDLTDDPGVPVLARPDPSPASLGRVHHLNRALAEQVTNGLVEGERNRFIGMGVADENLVGQLVRDRHERPFLNQPVIYRPPLSISTVSTPGTLAHRTLRRKSAAGHEPCRPEGGRPSGMALEKCGPRAARRFGCADSPWVSRGPP